MRDIYDGVHLQAGDVSSPQGYQAVQRGAGVVGRNFPRGRLAFVVGGLTGVIRPRGNVDQTNSSYLINV